MRIAGTGGEDGNSALPPIREDVELGRAIARRSLEHSDDGYTAVGAASCAAVSQPPTSIARRTLFGLCFALAAVTAAELLVGAELADDERRPRRTASVDVVLATIPMIPYDLTVARQHAHRLAHTRRAGRPRAAHDLQIAATAAATRRTVVTTDAHAFDGLPGIDVRLVDWF